MDTLEEKLAIELSELIIKNIFYGSLIYAAIFAGAVFILFFIVKKLVLNELEKRSIIDIERVKKEIEQEYKEKYDKWKIKKDACLEILVTLDSLYSHLDWGVKTLKQDKVSIKEVRKCFNELCVLCEDISVANAFLQAIPLNGRKVQGHEINHLRKEIRKELCLPYDVEMNDENAWISSLDGVIELEEQQ